MDVWMYGWYTAGGGTCRWWQCGQWWVAVVTVVMGCDGMVTCCHHGDGAFNFTPTTTACIVCVCI